MSRTATRNHDRHFRRLQERREQRRKQDHAALERILREADRIRPIIGFVGGVVFGASASPSPATLIVRD